MSTAHFTVSFGQLDHEQVMETINAIPPLPASVSQLNRLFTDPNFEIKQVARVIELDPALCGRILRMANSVSYGPGRVATIGQAVVRLGGGSVKAAAVAECLRPTVTPDLSTFGLTPFSFWRHNAAVVCFAEELIAHNVADFTDELPVAAVLHDFGKVVLAKHASSEQARLLHPKEVDLSADRLELEILGLDHAEVGAAVAQHWDLSENVVRAIQYHHRPEQFDHPISYGLCLANHLTRQLEGRDHEAGCVQNLDTCIEALQIRQQGLQHISERGAARFRDMLDAYA